MSIPVGFETLRQILALRHCRLNVFGNITSNPGMWTQRVAMGWLTWESGRPRSNGGFARIDAKV